MMLNHDALIEALGECLRALYGPVEQQLPNRLASLLDQLESHGNLLASKRVSFSFGADSSSSVPERSKVVGAHGAIAAPAAPPV